MKKASRIVLLVIGIINTVFASCYLLALLPIVLLTFGLGIFICIPFGLMLAEGIIAIIASRQKGQASLITTIVFAFLIGDWIGITGAILGLLGFEKKEEGNIVVAEEKDEEEIEKEQKKYSLTAFILAMCGIAFSGIPVVGMILCGLALRFLRKAKGIEVKPHKVFNAITKPVAIVFLVWSSIVTATSPVIFAVFGYLTLIGLAFWFNALATIMAV